MFVTGSSNGERQQASLVYTAEHYHPHYGYHHTLHNICFCEHLINADLLCSIGYILQMTGKCGPGTFQICVIVPMFQYILKVVLSYLRFCSQNLKLDLSRSVD